MPKDISACNGFLTFSFLLPPPSSSLSLFSLVGDADLCSPDREWEVDALLGGLTLLDSFVGLSLLDEEAEEGLVGVEAPLRCGGGGGGILLGTLLAVPVADASPVSPLNLTVLAAELSLLLIAAFRSDFSRLGEGLIESGDSLRSPTIITLLRLSIPGGG